VEVVVYAKRVEENTKSECFSVAEEIGLYRQWERREITNLKGC